MNGTIRLLDGREDEMSETKEKNHLQPDNETGLMDAVNQMFYSVLLVNPKEDSVLILQDHDCPETVQTRMNWTEYLERYSAILTEEERAKVWKRLSSHALLAAASGKETSFTLDVSCLNQKQNHTDWSTISAVIKQTGSSVSAYIFIRQSNEEHLLKSIINLYVYNTCDYFIYLNAQNNSYVMFSGSNNGTPLPPEICNDYASALVEYARNYVVPEDQEMVIREMQIDRVLEQLDLYGVHSFYCGVTDPIRGYTRKQLSYRYYDRNTRMVLLSRTDVTDVYLEERLRQEELKNAYHQAETDTLTGLLNYKGLRSRVEAALAEDKQSALLFIDLDNFKQVNDTLGHMEGNRLLCQIAQILRTQTRMQDFQGRVGGDEFVVYLRNIRTPEQATGCARRICDAVSRLSDTWNNTVPVSCSIGIAIVPKDGLDYTTLFTSADQLAYRAKSAGKNRYYLL